MNEFKKNIFKKRTSDNITPPTFFTFTGTKGDIFCNNGTIDISNLSPATIYSTSSSLSSGVSVFDDSNLTIPSMITGFKSSGVIYEITAGVIDVIYSVNSPC